MENVCAAKKMGLCAIAITDHSGYIMPDAPSQWYFKNMRVVPREIEGVKVLRGIEANVLGKSGRLDTPEAVPFDWVLASIHDYIFADRGVKACTEAYLAVAENPIVNVIAHSGTPGLEYDYERVLPIFKENHKLVEINNGSALSRPGSIQNCKEIAEICKKYEVPVVLGTDSHICQTIGKFEHSLEILGSVDFPEELIVNANEERLYKYLMEHTFYFKRV
jgi:putative hydrolase